MGLTLPKRIPIPETVSAASGILLSFAFPPHGEPALAWFALAPFFVALRYVPPRRAFRVGFCAGLGFWLFSISWFWALIGNGGPWPLVILGHIALSAYCALYFALFAFLLSPNPATPATSETPETSATSSLARVLLSAVVWTGLEWVRSTFLTGFAWNHLGVTQYRSLPLLQLASLGGVYAVTFPVALANAAIASAAVRMYRGFRQKSVPRHHFDLVAFFLALIGATLWGIREQSRWARLEHDSPPFIVAGIQPNAPSIFERGEKSIRQTLKRLSDRTEVVAHLSPDLVVWPETILMGSVPGNAEALDYAFRNARACNTPILAGAVEYYAPDKPGGRPFVANASLLFGPDRAVHGLYRKQHLVPFGEYIPLDSRFPFLERLSPIGYSCTPGDGPALFTVAPDELTGPTVVSPLICFEDTVAPLASRAVREGAMLLVNQTNDAWFEGSREAAQHHAQAVFRAVETRTPLVRVSNAGVSGIVFASGAQSTPATYFCEPACPRQPGWPLPPYARHGDWLLAIPCAIAALLLAVWRCGKNLSVQTVD